MDEYKYEVEEVVRVRSDLNYNKVYGMQSGPHKGVTNSVTEMMFEMAGKLVHISEHYCGQYRIAELRGVCWTDEMFEDPNCLFHPLIV